MNETDLMDDAAEAAYRSRLSAMMPSEIWDELLSLLDEAWRAAYHRDQNKNTAKQRTTNERKRNEKNQPHNIHGKNR